jgi:hypothetical protein
MSQGQIHVPPPDGGPGGGLGGGHGTTTDLIPPPDYGELLSINSTLGGIAGSQTVVQVYPGTELCHGTLISPTLNADIGIHYEDSCVAMDTDSFYFDAPKNPDKDCIVYLELSDARNIIRGEIIVVIAAHSRHVLTILPFPNFDVTDDTYVIRDLYITEIRSAMTGTFHAEGDVTLSVYWSPRTASWGPDAANP